MSAGCRRGSRAVIFGWLIAGAMLSAEARPALDAVVVRNPAENSSPVISGTPPTSVQPGQLLDFTPVASDPDGDRLRFSASLIPKWARFDARTGRLYGSPSRRDLGKSYGITISVSDGVSSASLPRFTLRVAANAAPTLSGTPAASAKEGALYAFEPVAGDADGDALTFSVQNRPAWATFTTSTGLLSGIPPIGSAGTYSNITIAVSDGQSTTSLPPFSISVSPAPNQPPSIWGVPPGSVEAGQVYSFRPNASDPEGQALRFSVQGLPAWATLDTTTGTLRGTPLATQAGTYSNIVISVSDGQLSAALAPFSIKVTTSNVPPTISGVPSGTATVGQVYSFVPNASDPDGQKLTFAIAGQPAWAQFDPATGRLYGTPADASVGTYTGIRISVSDGQASAALPTFSIVVQKPVSGSATVSWVPPTTNVDGSPLTNLAGYRIAYGSSASSLSQTVEIPSPTVTSATIERLSAGTWYFAVRAYTATGVESDLSNVGQKTIL